MTALFDLIDRVDPWMLTTFLALALWLLTEWELRRARDRGFRDGLEVGDRISRLGRPRR